MRILIAGFALASLVMLAGCGSKEPGGVAVDSAFRGMIPADTRVLVHVQLDKLKTTALYERHQKDLEFPFLASSSERLGIDPRRDIADVLIVWNGTRPLFLVRGTFQPAEIEKKLADLHIPRNSYKRHQVFGDGKNSVVLLGKGLAAAGPAGDVQKAIDTESDGAGTLPEELQQRLEQVSKDEQIWIVSRGGLPFADMPMRSDYQSALSNITNFITGATIGIRADAGIHFKMEISCISEQGAQRVHDALRGAVGLGRLSTKDDQRELLQVYDGVNIEQDKATVRVHADYSGPLTDQVFEQLRQVKMLAH